MIKEGKTVSLYPIARTNSQIVDSTVVYFKGSPEPLAIICFCTLPPFVGTSDEGLLLYKDTYFNSMLIL